jgi:hypothetical protein
MKRILLLASVAIAAPLFADETPANYKLVYEQKFENNAALADFVFTDASAWRLAHDGTTSSLELFGKSKYEPKHRSPFNIALLTDRIFGDFVLEVDAASTIAPYPHQDMCLFFGFEATNKFYYTHIAMRADPVKKDSHAHDIFIVNDAPRLAIAADTTKGVEWGQNQWHKIRVERATANGSIKVYFDDLSKPIMTAVDKTFSKGWIGFGSFDDTGKFKNIRIWSPSVEKKSVNFFNKK